MPQNVRMQLWILEAEKAVELHVVVQHKVKVQKFYLERTQRNFVWVTGHFMRLYARLRNTFSLAG
jgi:hypothetical protein